MRWNRKALFRAVTRKSLGRPYMVQDSAKVDGAPAKQKKARAAAKRAKKARRKNR
jgi:hypothetical protein